MSMCFASAHDEGVVNTKNDYKIKLFGIEFNFFFKLNRYGEGSVKSVVLRAYTRGLLFLTHVSYHIPPFLAILLTHLFT